MKDPVLDSYTHEELLYEYFDTIEREKAALTEDENTLNEAEEAVFEDNLAWAEEEERKEREALEAKKAAEEAETNRKWMREQIDIEKKRLGLDDSFGEDLSFKE